MENNENYFTIFSGELRETSGTIYKLNDKMIQDLINIDIKNNYMLQQ